MTDTCQREDVIPSQCFQTLKMDCISLSPRVFIYRESVCGLHLDNSRATKNEWTVQIPNKLHRCNCSSLG